MMRGIIKNEKALLWGFFFVSALLGGLSSLAMAPYHYWGLLLIGLAALFIVQHKLQKPINSFFSGWLFGFFYFLFSLSWIGNALLVEGNDYAWAWPLAVSGLPFLLAFFPAFACYTAKKWCATSTISHAIGLIAFLSFAEWLRGHVFTGFPWNLYGYAWGDNLEMLQILHFGNAYILTAITIFWGVLFGFIYLERKNKKALITGFTLITVSSLSIYAYGHFRLTNAGNEYIEDKTVRIVQPNVAQFEKWQRDKMTGHFERMLELSRPDGTEDNTTYIIWPETATSYLFLNNAFALSQISDVLNSYSGDAFLITGALIRNDDGSPSNSLIVLNKDAKIIHRYDKSHLVPFGEYIPFQNYIPIKSISGFSGFKKGDGRTKITINDDFSFSPLVCYEILFPSKVIDPSGVPDAIINVTNDGWYGLSSGPHQHLMKARFRAIEEGVTVIRSANTGISAIIDGYGRFSYKTSLFKESTATHKIHKKITTN